MVDPKQVFGVIAFVVLGIQICCFIGYVNAKDEENRHACIFGMGMCLGYFTCRMITAYLT